MLLNRSYEEKRLTTVTQKNIRVVKARRVFFQAQIQKICRTFARGALRFVYEIDGLDDTEVVEMLERIIKRQDERAKLERIGRLLNGGFSTV